MPNYLHTILAHSLFVTALSIRVFGSTFCMSELLMLRPNFSTWSRWSAYRVLEKNVPFVEILFSLSWKILFFSVTSNVRAEDYRYYITVLQKKKVSCEEEQLVHSDCWGSIKQPYVGGISSSIRRGEFSTLKVRDSCYFCVIFPFVIISTKVFETYTNWEKPLELFSEFFVRTLLRERDFLLGKRDFATFWSYKTRDSGPLRARNTMFNNSIDRSKSEEHLEFFSEVFLITLVQKQSL